MLSQLAIDVLTGNVRLKEKIAERLNVQVRTVTNYVRDNEDLNPLTSIAIVNLIAEETGLMQDQIIKDKTAA